MYVRWCPGGGICDIAYAIGLIFIMNPLSMGRFLTCDVQPAWPVATQFRSGTHERSNTQTSLRQAEHPAPPKAPPPQVNQPHPGPRISETAAGRYPITGVRSGNRDT